MDLLRGHHEPNCPAHLVEILVNVEFSIAPQRMLILENLISGYETKAVWGIVDYRESINDAAVATRASSDRGPRKP